MDTGKNGGGRRGGVRVDTRVLPVCDCSNHCRQVYRGLVYEKRSQGLSYYWAPTMLQYRNA